MIKFINQRFLNTICIILIIATLNSCTKEDTNTPQTGQIIFWTNAPITGLQIDVTVTDSTSGASYTGAITTDYNQATAPDCGSPGCYTINNLKIGTYFITGTDGTHTWGQFPYYFIFRMTSNNVGHCNHSLFTY